MPPLTDVDAFWWSGVSYVWTRRYVPLSRVGPEVTTIDCSVAELTAPNHLQVEAGPWPDRTSTFLPSGTPIYRIAAVRPTCQLAVRVDDRVQMYEPVDRRERLC